MGDKKQDSLNGQKLMIVKRNGNCRDKGDVFVAADMVGAGVGEDVLVVTGSTARRASEGKKFRWTAPLWGLLILGKS